MKRSLILFSLALVLALPVPAQAHFFWLMPDQTAAVGKPGQVEVGFGHKFPKDEEIKAERLQSVKVIGPDGKELPLTKISTVRYEFVPPAAGFYLISAQMKPGFVCRTPQGMKMQTKKELPDAEFCFHFDMACKTLVDVGKQSQGYHQSAKSVLEVMPLQAPNTLKAGGEFPVKVLFQGKPLPGAEITVTHTQWPDPKKQFAVVGKTDAQGEFRLKLDKPGRWLVIAGHKTPYPDKTECDENMYRASLSFEVK